MDKHYGVLFNRKSGKIIKTIEAYSSAMLKMYALNNTSPTRDFVVFNGTTGEISFYCEGKKNDFPTMCRDMEGKNIDDLCASLRDALKEEEQG